jgi:small subunit ribosomal protein S1
VLHINASNRRLSLGIKQLQPDAWETFFRAHQVGDMIKGKVCRAANFGMFVELAEGVEGLCHNSEIPGGLDKRRTEPPLEIGKDYEFKIIKMSEAEKKIGLSVRALGEDEERNRLEEYQRRAAAATMTIEEVINLKGQGETRSQS